MYGVPPWNAFVGDASLVFVSAGFYIVIYADDLNAFKGHHERTANSVIFDDLKSRQGEFHKWGWAIQVTFDAGKNNSACYQQQTPQATILRFLVLSSIIDFRSFECSVG